LHGAHAERYPFLLESVAHGTSAAPGILPARYDILFAFPGKTLVLAGNATSHVSATSGSPSSLALAAPFVPGAANFLQALDDAWAHEAALSSTEVDPVLPFSGGWFIYLGYGLAAQIEPRLALAGAETHGEAREELSGQEPLSTSRLPIAFATRIPAAVIVDHHVQCTFLVAEDAVLLDRMAHDLEHLTVEPHAEVAAPISALQEDDPTRFLDGVRRIKEYIVAGDVFQVNLSRGYRATLAPDVSYMQLYQGLRKNNPAPFAGVALYKGDAQGRAEAKGSASADRFQYPASGDTCTSMYDAGGTTPGAASAILSSSPERLVRVQGDVIEVRPIAGTRPRGMGDEDVALSQALLAHPKERAEHVMLIDLERNDLGRVCVPGSVQVDELMVLESYAHVHHIVSNVRGIKRPEVTPGQVIRAVFPGGTITGCPKVRCMEIIAELEQTPRGPYTGAMGYLNHNGNMDLNILIRTMLVENGDVQFRVGAGIVADSVPDAELQETRAKARGLLLALGASG
jgi:anthranilate synthase component 1